MPATPDAVAEQDLPVVAGLQQGALDQAAAPEPDRVARALDPALRLGDRLLQLLGGLQPQRHVGQLGGKPVEQLHEPDVVATDDLREILHDPR